MQNIRSFVLVALKFGHEINVANDSVRCRHDIFCDEGQLCCERNEDILSSVNVTQSQSTPEGTRGVESWLHAFLTSALDGDEWLASRP